MEILYVQFRVIVALILRIIRTRFFGHGLGFLVSIGWPLAHILILLGIHALADRAAPYGTSLVVVFSSALVPYMTFSYMARFIMITVIHNRSLLVFPAVKITDLIYAGAIVEALSACCMVIVLGLVLAVFGIDFMPQDPVQAAFAFGASILLGLGIGFLNAVVAMVTPLWVTGFALANIVLYLISGIFFVPEALPQKAQYLLSFNPVLQVTEWMRSAYYQGYGSLLDKPYAIGAGVLSLAVGLIAERMFRGRLLVAT